MFILTIFLWFYHLKGISCGIIINGNSSTEWSVSTELFCPELDKINNGNIIVQKLGGTKTIAVITCDRGYEINGNNKLHCVDGQWEYYKPLPQCEKRCLPPPYVKEGSLEIDREKDEDGYYPKGTVAAYSCSGGYDLVPETSRLRVCERGIWTGPLARCIPTEVSGCPLPNGIENGNFIQEKTEAEEYNNVGERLQYSCNTGYSLVGPRTQRCLDDGTWSPAVQPKCLLADDNLDDIPCDTLPTVPHSDTEVIQQTDRRSMAGVTVEIRCLGKYRNSLNPCQTTKLKCQAGKWVGVLPTCVPVHECLPPPLAPYATIIYGYNPYDASSSTKFPIKSSVTYQCLQGFALEGGPVMSCTIGGCWSPRDPPMCVRSRVTPAHQPTGNDIFLEVDNINAILMSAAAGAGVLGILLLICLMVACRRRKQHSTTVAIPQPLPRQDMGDHAALLEHPDRLALIGFADDVQRNQNLLPSYDEAIRNERGASLSANRPHRPHWPNLAVRRARNSPNPEAGHVTRHGSFASHTPSTRSAGDSMGSTDTMAVSEGSTNVTLDTASSHSGSQPASCRAHCGSLASFDACSVVNTEDVPLLEESELEEIQGGINDMENPAISENTSLKISTNSGDILSV